VKVEKIWPENGFQDNTDDTASVDEGLCDDGSSANMSSVDEGHCDDAGSDDEVPYGGGSSDGVSDPLKCRFQYYKICLLVP